MVETRDNRYNPFFGEDEYTFLELTRTSPPWMGSSMKGTINITYDGLKYHPKKIISIMGLYYFYSEEMTEH